MIINQSIICHQYHHYLLFNCYNHMMLLILLAYLITVSVAGPLYFSLPYRTVFQDAQAQHLIKVEINRYNYDIDITLESQQDHILSLQWAAQTKQLVDRPDYRKNQQSIFGIVEFTGTQRADDRLQWKRRNAYNIYYYFRDFFTRITWANLSGVKQIQEEHVEGMRQGAFNFGPANANSQLLRNFRKYSKYMGKTVISFVGNLYDENGEIIFGELPSESVVNGEIHSCDMEYLGEKHWIISTIALELHHKSGKTQNNVELYREAVRVKISISQRTVVIPLASAERIVRALPHCTFQQLALGGKNGKYLACKDLKNQQLALLSLNFTIRDASLPLSLHIKDLELPSQGNSRFFAVRSSQIEDYQIGETILRNFAIGIDYRSGKLMYGHLSPKSSLTRVTLFKLFIAINVILFLVSAVLVALEKPVRERMKVAVKEELGLTEQDQPSKVNSYELANISQQTLSE